VRAAARSARVPHEILVVDDDSSDRTAAIAAEYGAQVVRVQHRHIAATRNAGARAAQGNRFVFVDADTIISASAVREAAAAMRAGAVGGGSLVQFDEPLPRWAKILLPVIHALMRARYLAAGCFLFCTREAFEAAGGFDEKRFAGEEVAMTLALRKQGRFVMLDERIVTSGRKLRAYSGFEILRMFAGVLARGPRAVASRDGLDLWYGPRREDPALRKSA
jgi:glycosyltransferase involved in cell wall biosynthesis